MQIRLLIITLIILTSSLVADAQNDPVLFSVGNTKVYESEFKYIYEKTNGQKADYSKGSVNEYLDLYIKFKLKVEKAKEMKIDTIPSLQQELDGYRRQLSDSYLIDKEVKERLLREAYDRIKKDVNISHIMVAIKGRQTPKDTLEAFKKISDIKEQLDKGKGFEDAAKTLSEDPYSGKTGGRLGWITALLPNGFYHMESAAYNTAKGKYSKPVRTSMGYHIIKVNETRKARGSMELAHILIRKDEKNPAKDPKALIQTAYQALKSGKDFENAAREFSDDKKSAAKGGYLGFFGIGVNEPSFEDAAFALKKDGDYSEPIKTSAGWHILKRISKAELGRFEEEKNRLQVKIEQDSRFKEARTAIIHKIKKNGNYKVDEKVLSRFTASLDKQFLTTKWRAPKKSNETLFSFGESADYTLGDFTDALLRMGRKRSTIGRTTDLKTLVDVLLEHYSDEKALEYEKSQLAEKYPDFKSLMREYEEGILLFEVTKKEVWDKASQDTVGLENYYNSNSDNYTWNARAEASTYTLKSQSEKILGKTRKLAGKKSSEDVLKKINKNGNLLTVTTSKMEKGKTKYEYLNDSKTKWVKGLMTPTETNNDDSSTFVKLEKILPKEKKSLKEARGYVIADYQDELERQWIEQLKKEYAVKINQETLSNLIR